MPTKRPSENHTPHSDGDPLGALCYELLHDLGDAIQDQKEMARKAIAEDPTAFQQRRQVEKAARIADVCRHHAARCVQIHANRNEQKPAKAAMEILSRALCKHLGVPPDTSLISGPWPESSEFVREFVRETSGGMVDLTDGKAHGPFGRVLGREAALRDLEELFWRALSERWTSVYATAVSAVPTVAKSQKQQPAGRTDEKARAPREIDQRKTKIARIKAANRRISARDVCKEMDAAIASTSRENIREQYAPLWDWIEATGGKKRTWVALFDDQTPNGKYSRVHRCVKGLINKVKPLQLEVTKKLSRA